MCTDKEEIMSSFVFYKDWYDAISSFESSVRCEVYDSIMRSVFYGEEQEKMSPLAKMAMNFISPQIGRDKEKYASIKEKRLQCGRLGGRPRKPNGICENQEDIEENQKNQMVFQKPNGFSENQTKPKKPVDVDVNGDVDDNGNGNKKKSFFKKPTIEEIQKYISEKNYHFSAEQFFAFYESKGWKVGSQPMKDWKMACVTWEGRTGSRTQQPTQSQQPRKTFTDWNSTEALTEQYNIEAERRKKQQEEEDRESRIRSFQVQILDYLSRHRDDYKTLEQGDVKENDYFTITGLPDGTMYWNCKCANCKRRTYYDEAMKCVNECPLDAPMRPKGDDDTSYIWDKVSKMWVMY